MQVEWPDKNIHKDVRDGFKLTALQHPSGIFAADVKPRSLTEEDLVKQLKFLQPALWAKYNLVLEPITTRPLGHDHARTH